jgi:hypothetical protein
VARLLTGAVIVARKFKEGKELAMEGLMKPEYLATLSTFPKLSAIKSAFVALTVMHMRLWP